MRADDFGRAVGSLPLDVARDHHLALMMAVTELTAEAGRAQGAELRLSRHDDPTVALLRAAAKLALVRPDATSAAAADLLDRIAGSQDPRPQEISD